MDPMKEVLTGSGLEIRDSTYTLTVKAMPRTRRGQRIVRVDVDVRLRWAVPLQIEFLIPHDTDVLRDMLERLRALSFAEWLHDHGYDEYGRCQRGTRCTFGDIIQG